MNAALLRLTRRLVQFRAKLGHAARDQQGMAAVEFAMLLPLLVTLFLGGVEVSQAVSIDRKVALVARTVADLVAQGSNITNAEMTNIVNAGKAVGQPYPDTNLKIVVSSVKIDANSKATIAWSDGSNTTARTTNQDVTTLIPAGLKVANTSVIWAEVSYAYTPTIGYIITGTMNLADRIFMRPRLQDNITRSTT